MWPSFAGFWMKHQDDDDDNGNDLPASLRRAWQAGRVFDDRRTHDDRRESDPNSWRPVLIGGLWAVLMAVMGWVALDASDARKTMAQQIAANGQRITMLEAEMRFNRETLQRIEMAGEDNRKLLQTLLREGKR